jgi:hypothetical protein
MPTDIPERGNSFQFVVAWKVESNDRRNICRGFLLENHHVGSSVFRGAGNKSNFEFACLLEVIEGAVVH